MAFTCHSGKNTQRQCPNPSPHCSQNTSRPPQPAHDASQRNRHRPPRRMQRIPAWPRQRSPGTTRGRNARLQLPSHTKTRHRSSGALVPICPRDFEFARVAPLRKPESRIPVEPVPRFHSSRFRPPYSIHNWDPRLVRHAFCKAFKRSNCRVGRDGLGVSTRQSNGPK
jgi:hypothetical protein